MSKRDKRLEEWKSNPKPNTPWGSVESDLLYYGFEIDKSGGGSHFQISHQLLMDQAGYGANGEFTIAVKNGRTLKRWALLDIVQAIELLERLKNEAE